MTSLVAKQHSNGCVFCLEKKLLSILKGEVGDETFYSNFQIFLIEKQLEFINISYVLQETAAHGEGGGDEGGGGDGGIFIISKLLWKTYQKYE